MVLGRSQVLKYRKSSRNDGDGGVQHNSNDPVSLSTGKKAGIGVAIAVAILAMVVVIAVVYMRRKRRSSGAQPQVVNGSKIEQDSVAQKDGRPLYEAYGKSMPATLSAFNTRAELEGGWQGFETSSRNAIDPS